MNSFHLIFFCIKKKVCGLTFVTPKLASVEAKKNSWPFQVFIVKMSTNRSHIERTCSGTLINRKTVLTSASCIIPHSYYHKSNFKVFVGNYEIFDVRKFFDRLGIYVKAIQIVSI